MIVVSDTSPLTNLAAIGQFNLLHSLFGEVYIARQVHDELTALGHRWPGADEVDQADWVHICEVTNIALFQALQRDLDAGEAASIAIALELKANLILLDEMDGRRAAQRLGLEIVGTLGVLLSAKSRSLIPQLQPLIDALRRDAGFYISDTLYDEIMRLAKEA